MSLPLFKVRITKKHQKLNTVSTAECMVPVNPKYFVTAYPVEENPLAPLTALMLVTGPMDCLETLPSIMAKIGPHLGDS